MQQIRLSIQEEVYENSVGKMEKNDGWPRIFLGRQEGGLSIVCGVDFTPYSYGGPADDYLDLNTKT